ncbi:RNA polymerase sigma factor [Amphibacillus sp. Q70]|uniref:RNA polymerase sigma factor n=1 Tax=Amphibacillus sp. Q70 TaxID=3453416 RepID=UPI003F826D67
MNNEGIWIKKIQRNTSDLAANKLVNKYYKEIYAFVFKQTLNRELSLDLTQEIFISVLRSLKNYDSKKASFRTWLYKVASNRLVDYYRSKSYKDTKQLEPIEDYEFTSEDDLAISLEYKEDVEKVTTFVNELDAGAQQIIRLKLFGEYTFQEIAQMEMIPESTVKTKYYAVLKRIRKRMGGYDE